MVVKCLWVKDTCISELSGSFRGCNGFLGLARILVGYRVFQ